VNPARLNSDVIWLMDRREELLAELNQIEHELQQKRKLLIAEREVETAAHDVWRQTERRSSCV
jgi:tmRNA-binding protein